MANKIYIEWEHGDADFHHIEKYKIENINDFLNFITKIMGYDNDNFIDDHYTRIESHVNPIIDQFPQYQNIIPDDVKYSQYRPAINKIWLQIDGHKKYIVWTKFLKEIEVPEIDSSIEISTHGQYQTIKYY